MCLSIVGFVWVAGMDIYWLLSFLSLDAVERKVGDWHFGLICLLYIGYWIQFYSKVIFFLFFQIL